MGLSLRTPDHATISRAVNNLIQQVKASFERETPLFAVLKILRYGFYLLRSLPLRWSLNAPGLYIGPKFLLLGTKHLIIGKNFYAHSNLWIEAVQQYKNQRFNPQIVIGSNVNIGDSVHISCNNKVLIGDNVLLGSNIYIGDHQHGTYTGLGQCDPMTAPSMRSLSTGAGVEIGGNTWIGNNVVIVGSVKIGAGCVIAANSVVTRDVDMHCVVAGCPAKVIKHYDSNKSIWISI